MIFIENKYTKIYFDIIKNAQSRPNRSGYVEHHHIIPKSLGGSNAKNNLVKLTAREHFICHWLLTKMVSTDNEQYKVDKAFLCMSYLINSNHERYRIYGRAFENVRKKCSMSLSKKMLGDNNPMYGKTHTDTARKKISDSRIGKTPWNKGITHSHAARKKISDSRIGKTPWNKGITHSNETKAKLSIIGKNRAPISEETRKKMMESHQNRVPISEETRKKMMESAKKRVFKTVVCKYCGLSGKGGNMTRWHGDNCKMKPTLT
jgi:hypothetical protein